MKNKLVEEYYNWFKCYVKEFYGEDSIVNQNIELKEKHTMNVTKHAVNIAKSLKLTEEQVNTAEIIGLFHDIGRFEQFKTYKTFRDDLSENHAVLGIKILEDNKVLDNLDNNMKNIIIKAIKLHNTKELPSDLNGDEDIFSKIIRDADKLDIFRIVVEYEKERENNPNPAIDDLPFSEGYNKEFLEDIILGRKISNSALKNYNDRKIYELSWIQDLNFPFSLNYIKDKKILEMLVNCLPKNEEIKQIHKFLEKYIDNFEITEIRRAKMEDLEYIVRFNYNLAKETEDKELDLDVLNKGVQAILNDPSKGQYYVYLINNEVVGQIMHTNEWSDWRNGMFLWVQSVYVDSNYRRKGIFKELYNYVKKICDEDEGIAGIRLYVEKENFNAKSTYKSLGMSECNYHMYEYEK